MSIPINVDPIQQFKLWKRGLSLEEAWWRFGSREQRERHKSVQPGTKLPDQESFSALSQADQIKATVSSISNALRPILDQARIANEMRDQLVELLRKGKLVGYGYHSPRQLSDRPVRIPDDLFDVVFVRWDKSEIEGNESKYFAVKIFRASWLKELSVPDPGPTATDKKVGRPSMKTLIGDALTFVEAGKSIFEGESKKSVAARVREHIRSINENNISAVEIPSEKTILKYLAKLKSKASP